MSASAYRMALERLTLAAAAVLFELHRETMDNFKWADALDELDAALNDAREVL